MDGSGGNQYDYPGGRRIDSAAPKRNPNQYNQQQQQQQQEQQQQQQKMQLKPASSGDGGMQSDNIHSRQQQHDIMSRDDKLEYFIKFPSPSGYRSTNQGGEPTNGTDTGVFVYNENDNVPIVMLLGWAGCQDRYLMKYSKIYEDRGLITVRYTAPVDTLFWKRTAMVPIGEKMLKLIYDMNFDAHPVIFHIFSNGGAYLYQHISLAIKKHRTPVKIRGMIFDSAPGERRVLGLYRAVSAIYGKDTKKCNFVTAVIITMTLSAMWFFEETISAFKSLFVKSAKVSQTNPFNDLKNEPNKFPQMFIYSKGDVVIPYEDVEKFAKIRQEQGVEVESACFEDAEHVKIYTKYPAQYVNCVCTFINKCLSRPYREADVTSYDSTPTTSVSVGSNKYD